MAFPINEKIKFKTMSTHLYTRWKSIKHNTTLWNIASFSQSAFLSLSHTIQDARRTYRRLSSWACKSCIDTMPMVCISSEEYSDFTRDCSCTWASTILVLKCDKTRGKNSMHHKTNQNKAKVSWYLVIMAPYLIGLNKIIRVDGFCR